MGAEGAWPDPHFRPGPLWSLGYSYPWPILHSPCAPLRHRHTNGLSDTLAPRTHALPPPPLSPSRMETWHRESRQCRQLRKGRHVGRSFGQAVGGGRVSIVRGWRVLCGQLSSVSFFFPSTRVALREGSHLPTASHLRLRERLWHFEVVHHRPTSSLHTGWNHAEISCWSSLASSLFCHLWVTFSLDCYIPLQLLSLLSSP